MDAQRTLYLLNLRIVPSKITSDFWADAVARSSLKKPNHWLFVRYVKRFSPPNQQSSHSERANDQAPPAEQLEAMARNIVEQMTHDKYA